MAEPGPKTALVWGLKVLGVFAVFTVLATALFMGGFRNSGAPEESILCEKNLAALASASKLYATDNDGRLPGQGWDRALAKYLFDETALSCPRVRRSEPTLSGYALSANVANRRLVELAANEVFFFDYKGTEHGVVATIDEMPRPARHRNGRSNSVVYANGKSASVQAR